MDQLQSLDHQTVFPSIEEGKGLIEISHLSCQLMNRLKLEPNKTVLPCAIKIDNI